MYLELKNLNLITTQQALTVLKFWSHYYLNTTLD